MIVFCIADHLLISKKFFHIFFLYILITNIFLAQVMLGIHIYIYTHIYIHTYIYTHIYTYIYIYTSSTYLSLPGQRQHEAL